MSIPILPDRTQIQALIDLLESIALEETGLAHMLNAEGEKIQAIVAGMESGQYTLEEVLELQKSVQKVMKVIIKKEMLLQFKLEDILDFLPEIPEEPIIFSNVATAEGTFEGVTVSDTDVAFYYVIEPLNNNVNTLNQEVNER